MIRFDIGKSYRNCSLMAEIPSQTEDINGNNGVKNSPEMFRRADCRTVIDQTNLRFMPTAFQLAIQ